MSTKLSPGFDLNSVEVFILTAELGGMTQSARASGHDAVRRVPDHFESWSRRSVPAVRSYDAPGGADAGGQAACAGTAVS